MNSAPLFTGIPAPRLITARLVLRCYTPADAPLLKDALDSSLAHLCPWLSWVEREPSPVETFASVLELLQSSFMEGEKHVYGIFNAEESVLLGGTGIHPPEDGSDSREIGYWLRASATGRGYARESAAAMVREAFTVFPVREIMIRCDPRNVRSSAVAAALGFRHEDTVPTKLEMPGRTEDMVWRLKHQEWLRISATTAD